MATNFLKFCSMGSTNGVAYGNGVLGVDCVAGEGRIYTWSVEGAIGNGLLVALAVAVGFISMGNGFETSSLGSSIASFPLPSPISIGEVSSFFSHGPHTTHNCGASCISSGASAGSSFNSS